MKRKFIYTLQANLLIYAIGYQPDSKLSGETTPSKFLKKKNANLKFLYRQSISELQPLRDYYAML